MEKVINGLGRKNSMVNSIKYNTENKRRGISLIALVIVIIIILILTAAIIITVTSSSPIEEANEAVIRSDIRTMQEMYELAYSDAYIKNLGDESGIKNSDFKDLIPDKYKDEFKATSDGIIYVGDNETIEEIAKDMGIEKKEYNIIEDVVVTAGQTSVDIEVVIEEGEVVDSYIYQIREKGVENWTEFTNTSNKLTVEELEEDVEYEIKVVVKQEDKTYESDIVTVETISIVMGTLTLRLNNVNGEEYSENTWTNQNVYVAVEGENTTYSVSGANQVNETTASSTLSNDGVSTITLKTTSATAEKTQNYTVKIDRSLPVVNELVSSNTTLTNENITLTGKAIDTSSGIVAYQFSTNGNITAISSGWNEITSTTSEIEQNYTVSTNGTYYFYVKDEAGNVVKQSIEVSNIDKTNPSKAAPTVTSTTNSVTVTFNQTDENGIKNETRAYAIKKTSDTTWGEWITSNSSSYTFENLTMNISYDVKTQSSDIVGNTSESEVARITTVNITKPTITASSDWTNKNVEVTIVYPEIAGTTKEYSTDGTSWEEATSSTQKVTVSTNNTTVYARLKDTTGQISEIATYEVTNIDTTAPIVNSLTASNTNITNTDLTITGKAIDETSGIVAYQFSTDDSLTAESAGWIEVTSTTSEITQNYNITENGTYYFYVKDEAENVTKQEIVVDNIDKTLPSTTAPTLTSNTNSITATFKQTDEIAIDTSTRAYAIKKTSDTTWGEWVASNSSSYTFENLKMNISYDIKTKVSDTSGNTSESTVATISTVNITKPTLSSPTAWTNGSVVVTIQYPEIEGTTKEYSTNGTDWIDVTETTQTVTVSENNTTVYARIIDSTNQTSGNATYEVTCIDTEVPTIDSLTAEDATLTGKATDSLSGIIAYQFSNSDSLTEESTGWIEITQTTSQITQTYIANESGTYYFYVKDTAGNISKQNIEVSVVNENAPILPSGATAVKWDANNKEVETTIDDDDWYDYTEQIAATESGGTSKCANCKMSDGSYFVWIPRYAYKIDSTNKTIDVKFTKYVDGTDVAYDGTSLNGYIVHPAFKNDLEVGGWDSELPGIWVAKYEAGIPNSNSQTGDTVTASTTVSGNNLPVFKPNREAYTSINIGNIYVLAKEYNSDLNSHMMKNSEWGAVAYLAHSQYGRNGTEVTINNSSSYITGNAGNTISAGSASGVTNAYNTAAGTLASTTGNIYGIYDLSGGVYEYTAGYINNGNPRLTTYGSQLVSDGGAGTSTKYKTVYAYNTSSDTSANNYDVAENKSRVGEAIWETSTAGTGSTSWNGDYSGFSSTSSPFAKRGGHFDDDTYAGVFFFNVSSGSPNSYPRFPCCVN